MSLSDSRPEPPSGYVFPHEVGLFRSAGSPRFLGRSFHARCPLSPRQVRRLLAPIASPSIAGFRILGRLATHSLCNEAEPGSLALRLACSPREASPAGLLLLTLAWLIVERAINNVYTFQYTRSARLVLAHLRHRDTKVHKSLRTFVILVPLWQDLVHHSSTSTIIPLSKCPHRP